ncbi:MAG: hypothetical protein H6983_09680 [Ectothiorhodospiraceae bacterium]|nr:hypothetical protein [Chromatiales bacterium]MCP5154423.1 hypothetical protein [Ectothiorhodospiraceae bacterium]
MSGTGDDADAAGPWLRLLLGDLAPERFIGEHLDREPMHAEGAAAGVELLTVDAFERMVRGPTLLGRCELQVRRADQPDIRLATTPAEASEALSQGHVLHVNTLERVLDGEHPIARLAGALGDWLQAPLRGISVFLGTGGAQGLPLHHDDEDIFTFQLAGRKRWRLYPRRNPKVPSEASGEPGQAFAQVTMSPGDTLYLPRGFPHEVTCLDGPALSLGIAFRAADWSELMLGALAEVAVDDPALWAGAPPPGVALDESVVARKRAALHAAVDRLDATRLRAALARRRQGRRRAPAAGRLTFVQAMLADRINLQTPLQVVDRGGLRLVDRGDRVILVHGQGEPLAAPVKAREALVVVVESTGPFRPRDLGERLDIAGRLALARKLVRMGIVVRAD